MIKYVDYCCFFNVLFMFVISCFYFVGNVFNVLRLFIRWIVEIIEGVLLLREREEGDFGYFIDLNNLYFCVSLIFWMLIIFLFMWYFGIFIWNVLYLVVIFFFKEIFYFLEFVNGEVWKIFEI